MYYDTEHRILGRVEEAQLITKAQAGDKWAMDELIKCNIKLILKVSFDRGYLRVEDTVDDVIQEGIIGLMTAIKKFEVGRGLKLSTYATHWIYQNISRCHKTGKFDPCMNFPVHHSHVAHTLHGLMQEYNVTLDNCYELFRSLDHKSQAKENQVKRSFLFMHKVIEHGDSLLDFDRDTSSKTLFDSIVDPCRSPEDCLSREELQTLVNSMLSEVTYSDRDENIMRIRSGIGVSSDSTSKDTGELFGITRERVRQIQKGVMVDCKRWLISQGITRDMIE